MVYHLIVCNGKQVTFATVMFHLIPVYPQFFKCPLYHIPGILLVPEVFQDKTVHIVCIQVYAFIIFSLRHTGVGSCLPLLGCFECNTKVANKMLQKIKKRPHPPFSHLKIQPLGLAPRLVTDSLRPGLMACFFAKKRTMFKPGPGLG
jgi:hypothetical protein